MKHAFRVLLCAWVIAALPALQATAQETIHWGGEWQSAGRVAWLSDARAVGATSTVRVQARTGSFPLRAVFDGRARLDGPLQPQGEWTTRGHVDRLYLRWYLPAADVIVGKQAVNWGVGYAWSPTDVFNPPDPLDPDGLRPGVTAAVVQVPVGPLDMWSFALSEEKYGVRRRGNVSGTDWAALAIVEKDDYVVGADVKGDLGVGWHAAATYRWPHSGMAGVVHGLVGLDYSWLWGDLTWVGEYGFEKRVGTDGDYVHQLFQQLGYRVDDFTSVSGSAVVDLSGGAVIWGGSLSTFLGPQTLGTLSLSSTGGAAGSTLAPVPATVLQAQLKYSF